MFEQQQNGWLQIPEAMWGIVNEMSPYLLLGFLVAGLLSIFLSATFVQRHLGGRGWGQIVKASLFGVPMPLCSCGVIPVTAGLRKHGAGRGASTSFLLSTPQTGVDSILVTYSLLGSIFTLFRVIMAFLIGFVCGALVDLFTRDAAPPGAEAASDGEASSEREDSNTSSCCCGQGQEGKAAQRIRAVKDGLWFGLIRLPEDIGLHLIIGIAISGLLGALVSPDFIAETIPAGAPAILAMMALGIPLYVCSTASVPIAYALMTLGATPGAALAFLITGPATNAATVTTVWKMMGRTTALIYLIGVGVCAFGAGIVMDMLPFTTDITRHVHQHEMSAGWFQQVCSIVLIGLLAYGMRPKKRKGDT